MTKKMSERIPAKTMELMKMSEYADDYVKEAQGMAHQTEQFVK